MKTCVKCGSTEFSPRGDCRPCKREYDKKYRAEKAQQIYETKKRCYEANKDHYIAKSKSYYEENKEIIADKTKEYRAKNRDAILASKAEYRAKNAEKLRQSYRDFYEANKERRLEAVKAYRERNKEAVIARRLTYSSTHREEAKERAKAWLKNNKERAKERSKQYYKSNPEVFHNARVKRRNITSGQKLSSGLVFLLLSEQGGCCAGCSKELGDNFHLDHVMPLALGGNHEDNNIQLLCPRCNLTKHASHPIDWFKTLQKPTISSTTS